MADRRRGVIDTSVVLDLERIDPASLPDEMAIAAVTLAELAAGPHAASSALERAIRQSRLQSAEASFVTLPFDGDAARAYGRVFAAVRATGRTARGRAMDLLIAATALAAQLPLYTRNPSDFEGLSDLLDVVAIA